MKAVIAILLLVVACYFAGAEELIQALSKLSALNIFYLIALSMILIWVSCLKWRLFIRAHGHDAPLGQLMSLYTIGYFYNTFSPSYIVGDVARSMHLGKQLESKKDAFVSTFLERFTGLVAMAVVGVSCVLLGANATEGVQWAIVVVAVPIFVGAAMCFSATVGNVLFAFCRRCIALFVPKRFREKLQSLVNQVEEALQASRGNTGLLVKAFALSFLFHLLTVVNTYVAGVAVGWQSPSFMGLCIVVPLVLLVSMVPVTPSGLGLQEGAFLFFLERIGAGRGEALAVGLVLRAKIFLIAVVGAYLWAKQKKRPLPQADEVEAT